MAAACPVDSAPPDVCAVALCPALPAAGSMLCTVHRFAVRMGTIYKTGPTCPGCKREIKTGDWVTPNSHTLKAQHAICAPKVTILRKKDRGMPLFDGNDAA